MNRTRNHALHFSAALMVGVVACGCRQSPPASQPAHVPTSWTRLPSLPGFETPHRACAGLLRMAWAVSATDNRLKASPEMQFERTRDPVPYEIDFTGAIDEPPPPPPDPGQLRSTRRNDWAVGYARDHAGRTVTLVDDGWFVAFDAGEYGGSLWWYPRTPGSGRKLWDKNVRWLLRQGTDLVAIGGLAHLSAAEGVFLRISRRESQPWALVQQMPLLGAPSAMTLDASGRIVVATTASVERLDGDAVEVLAEANYLDRPYSVAVASGGAVVVGLRMFVHVLQPDRASYRGEWYVPPRCRTFEQGDFMCVCTGSDDA